MLELYYTKTRVLGAGRHNQSIAVDPLRFCIIKFQHKMDATPSFGVSMISEVPSNPQLTLERIAEI